MLKRWTWLALVLVALIAFVGCSDDDDNPITPSTGDTPFEAMVKAGAAYVNDSADCPGVLSATALSDNLGDYTVIDIRAEAAYLAGHIPGAYLSSLGTVLSDLGTVIPTDKPFVIACYSGQSAGHVKIAMELMGYEDTQSLLFGMSSWTTVPGNSWNGDGKTADNLTNPETTNNNASLTDHAYPTLTGDAATIVATRVGAMLTGGFKGVYYNDIKDNLDEYFVVNYFGEPDYLGQGTSGVPGHIPGAFQFTPYASLGMDEMLMNLPTDKQIVVYCWTGQHSSQVTAYLNMLGYDAVSLLFGSNNLFHSSLTGHKWTPANCAELPVTIGYEPTATFLAMAEAGADYLNDSADCPGVLAATALNDNLSDYTVIDIRAQGDYDAGHIPGAYHSSLGTVLTDIGTTIPTDLPFVIACYSGQSAGHVKIAMEMMGYEDTQSLLFGMCSWNAATSGSWNGDNGNVNNTLTNPETVNNNADMTSHSYPVLTGDAASIVATRASAMLAAGFKATSYNAIKDNLDEYFVINYFGEADYSGTGMSGVPGHIPGAYQFTPYSSLGVEDMLHNLPTDKQIVVYCWTGQHSSQVTAYLNMLGYDAVSLAFGSNNLFHDDLTAHKWSAAAIQDFPLEATPVN